jgi:DNA polymerase III delta prime subunit
MNNSLLKDNLQRLWSEDRLAHFYILQASVNEDNPREFLRTWAKELVATFIATQKDTARDVALETIDNGHADILFVQKDEMSKDYSVKDDTFDEFFRFQNFSNFELKQRFIIIDDAHSITKILSNKLLKTLEEPAPNTTILLLDPLRQEILPTISSRAIFLKIPSISKEQNEERSNSLSEYLRHKDIDETIINAVSKFEANETAMGDILDFLKSNKEEEFNFIGHISSYMSNNCSDYERLNDYLSALNWYEKAKTFNNHSPEKLITLLRCVRS